jgi:hypothetical protein
VTHHRVVEQQQPQGGRSLRRNDGQGAAGPLRRDVHPSLVVEVVRDQRAHGPANVGRCNRIPIVPD